MVVAMVDIIILRVSIKLYVQLNPYLKKHILLCAPSYILFKIGLFELIKHV